jgi:predicted nucleic acid-binding protein
MIKKIDPNKKIILDADVVIHFLKGDQIGLLSQIFPNKLYMPDVVFQETFHGREKTEVENLFRFGMVQELVMTTDIRIVKEYNRLKNKFGKGESACMAYCRFNNDVIGSSNLKDISDYCKEHDIEYLTTLDFIAEAYNKKLLTEAECDYFLYKVDTGNRIPFHSITKYIASLK